MPNNEEEIKSHRMVVEEIDIPAKPSVEEPLTTPDPPKEDILEEGISTSKPQVVEEKVVKDSREENTIKETMPKIKKEKSPVFWIIIPGIFLLGAILGGIVFYQKGVNTIKVDESPLPTATSEASATPSSTPSAKIDLSKYDVTVLNGSGIAGEAGKVKDLLTTAGFSVVSTGNASTYDYTKTIIKAKSTVEDTVIQELRDSLSKTYMIGDDQTLSSSSTMDIQVVVGSSKAE